MHLILLHGALGSLKQLECLRPLLEPDLVVHTIDFPGHGGTQTPDPFTIEIFARQVLLYMDQHIASGEGETNGVNIFGYSMGGYVAMYLARHYGNRLKKVATLATKYHWDEETAARETNMLQPELIQSKVPAFAKKLAEEHGLDNWKSVLNATSAMLLQMGKRNPLPSVEYPLIDNSCLLMIGDRDKMVPLRETQEVFQQLPNAQLAVLPQTPHPFEQVDKSLLTFLLRKFFS